MKIQGRLSLLAPIVVVQSFMATIQSWQAIEPYHYLQIAIGSSTQNGKIKMKKNIVALVMLCSSAAALGMSAPAQAEMGKNTIGPALFFGSRSTTVGIDSKFGVSDNLSLRPFVIFPRLGTIFGGSVTYDFNISRGEKVQIIPFVGAGVSIATANNFSNAIGYFTAGADFGIAESVELKAAIDVPFTSNSSTIPTSQVRLSAGFKF